MYAYIPGAGLGQPVQAGIVAGRVNYEQQQQQQQQQRQHAWQAVSAIQQIPGAMFMPNMMSPHYMLPHPSQRSPPDDYPSDDSSDPHGHDLGFLSLLQEASSSMGDDGNSSTASSGNRQAPSNAGNGRQSVHARQGTEAARERYMPSGSTEPLEDLNTDASKRRRGRPVGSKDRQPRVKRCTTSPQAPEQVARQCVAPSEGGDGRRKPWKIILTAQQAVEIYKKRTIGVSSQTTSSCRSNEVAEQYGVNSKTIRDIWNRATWVKATRPAWTEEEEQQYFQVQQASSARSGAVASNDAETSRSSESEEKNGSNRDGGAEAKRPSRGRPKGARDVRPRVKRKSDNWPEDEQNHQAVEWNPPPQFPVSSKIGMAMAGACVAGGLKLQRLQLQLPGAPLQHQDHRHHRDRMLAARHPKDQNSSCTNTSRSQTSSYDSHSGDQGSASDGSGSGSGNSPPQNPASPKQTSQMPGINNGGLSMAGNMPTLQAFNRYAHVQGLRPMDAGRAMPAHSWVSGLAPAAHRSNAHHQRSLAPAHKGGPTAQDVRLYPANHSLGGDGIGHAGPLSSQPFTCISTLHLPTSLTRSALHPSSIGHAHTSLPPPSDAQGDAHMRPEHNTALLAYSTRGQS